MEFTIKTLIKATAKEIYTTWLSSEGHANMTGGSATASDKEGDEYMAWDDYITGKNLELIPFKKIVQSWRSTQFEEHEEDSKIEIFLRETDGTTELTLTHTNIPETGEHYIKGWENHYFLPMKEYFSYKS